jgi:type I restriction enzyme S subunit
VAKIERLAAKIDEASGIQKSSHAEADAIYYSVMHSIWLDSDRWMRASIGNLIELVSGQVDPRFDPYASLPHINGEAMESGTGRLLNNYRLAKDDGVTSGKYHFAPGAVLYSKIRPYLRKAVIVPFEGVCSADVYAIQMIDGRIDAGFLKYSLLSPSFTEYANDISGGCQS